MKGIRIKNSRNLQPIHRFYQLSNNINQVLNIKILKGIYCGIAQKNANCQNIHISQWLVMSLFMVK